MNRVTGAPQAAHSSGTKAPAIKNVMEDGAAFKDLFASAIKEVGPETGRAPGITEAPGEKPRGGEMEKAPRAKTGETAKPAGHMEEEKPAASGEETEEGAETAGAEVMAMAAMFRVEVPAVPIPVDMPVEQGDILPANGTGAQGARMAVLPQTKNAAYDTGEIQAADSGENYRPAPTQTVPATPVKTAENAEIPTGQQALAQEPRGEAEAVTLYRERVGEAYAHRVTKAPASEESSKLDDMLQKASWELSLGRRPATGHKIQENAQAALLENAAATEPVEPAGKPLEASVPPQSSDTATDGDQNAPQAGADGLLQRIMAEPDENIKKPESLKIEQENPEIKRENPEIKQENPEIKQENPEIKREAPQIRQEHSATVRETPEVKPGNTEIKGEAPKVKPENTEIKGDVPEIRRENPEIRRGVPQVNPENPEIKKNTPETKRENPEKSDEALGAAVQQKPELPAEKPVTAAGTREAHPVKAPEQAEQVRLQVIENLEKEKMEFRMRLNPRELGEIDVKMVLESGRLAVEITAMNPKAAEALQRQAESLAASLKAGDLEVSSVNIVTAGENVSANMDSEYNLANGQGGGRGQGRTAHNAPGSGFSAGTENKPEDEEDLPQGLLNYSI